MKCDDIDPTLAKMVLDVNGFGKIYKAGRAEDLRWGEEEVASFISMRCGHWTTDDKVTLARLGMVRGSPAFTRNLPSNFPSVYQVI
jgi:hypothetical protein